MPWIFYAAAGACLLAGMLNAIQGPTNASLVSSVGSPINAALVSFAVGTIVLLGIALALRVKPDLAAVRGLPWWAWMGGLYGAFFVTVVALSVPRLGVAFVITLMIAGQLIMSITLDHFGAFGIAERPVSWPRIAGVALVFAGVLLVRRS
ncbi:MAG: DMT family transporter [Pseudomonadota bacterium]